VGFGNWLATNNKNEEALTALTRATTLDPLVPLGQTLLGVMLQRSDQLTLAREHLELALLDDPTDEDAADALREVEEKVGVLPANGKKELKRRFDAWARDAGR
jgi:predicted Zn-dependent protease